jgi:hypothetical protein
MVPHHPDFGIFLSDRDRFIQEHFFSGPGQIAHVIDPIRKIEGVFVWEKNRPSPAAHFWVGDRIHTGQPVDAEGAAGSGGGRHRTGPPGGEAARARPSADQAGTGEWLPPLGRLLIGSGVFLLGCLLATLYAGWERQRFVEGLLASNGVASLPRLGLSDQLDRLQRDLAGLAGPLRAARAGGQQADPAFGEIRDRLVNVSRRIEEIKARYGNTAAEDEYLRHFLAEKYAEAARARESPAPPAADGTKGQPAHGPPGAAKP